MCVCVRERQRQIQTGMGENKKDGVKESFTQKPNLWMLKRKRPKKSVNECLRVCVCFSVAFPMAIYSPATHWGLSGVHTQTTGEKNPKQKCDLKQNALSENISFHGNQT